MAAFERLIRFEADDGKTYYGDLGKEVPTREIEGKTVSVLDGNIESGFKRTGAEAKVSKVDNFRTLILHTVASISLIRMQLANKM